MGQSDILRSIFAFCSLEIKHKLVKIRDNKPEAAEKRLVCVGICLRRCSNQYPFWGIEPRWVISMNSLVHWFEINSSVLAVLVTVGVAVLLICCLECSNCPSREKDELFHRHEL